MAVALRSRILRILSPRASATPPPAASPAASGFAVRTRTDGMSRLRGVRPPRRRVAAPLVRRGEDLARAAAHAALQQRLSGDGRPLRELYRETFSFLRYFHHRWAPEHASG